jgi:hypothetical protein
MPNQIVSNASLYNWVRDLLLETYAGYPIKPVLIKTLAMMITGMLLAPHVQLYAIAMCVPLLIKLPSITRRLERFVADDRVQAQRFFAPFIYAMVATLGNETAYLIIDCTKVGPKCRTLFIAIAYHWTALPIVWKTYKGKKGHLKGEEHQQLMEQIFPYVGHCRRVVILGDAEFSNAPAINTSQSQQWGFVFRFQSNYQVQLETNGPWQSAQAVYEGVGLQPGQVRHWPLAAFTQAHQHPNLLMTIQWDEGQDEPLCLISNLVAGDQPQLIYDKRYWVETLFGNCKSRGFQLDRVLMTDPEHIDRLILAVAIATCLMLGLGTHLIVSNQRDQVDRADRRDLSLFQLGWRWFYRLLTLNRLELFKFEFRWDFKLPKAGFRPAS